MGVNLPCNLYTLYIILLKIFALPHCTLFELYIPMTSNPLDYVLHNLIILSLLAHFDNALYSK
jgi:hypothetical protein